MIGQMRKPGCLPFLNSYYAGVLPVGNLMQGIVYNYNLFLICISNCLTIKSSECYRILVGPDPMLLLALWTCFVKPQAGVKQERVALPCHGYSQSDSQLLLSYDIFMYFILCCVLQTNADGTFTYTLTLNNGKNYQPLSIRFRAASGDSWNADTTFNVVAGMKSRLLRFTSTCCTLFLLYLSICPFPFPLNTIRDYMHICISLQWLTAIPYMLLGRYRSYTEFRHWA